MGSFIPRRGAAALIPEEVAQEIIQGMVEMSAVMRLGNRAPDMARHQRSLPCLNSLPTAFFVNPGPGSVIEGKQWKKLTNQMWEDKYIDAEEIAAIVPIPQAVLDDAAYDIWGQVRPRLIEAFGRIFDMAVFYGINAPAVWPTAIVPSAIAANNAVVIGSLGDLYDDILGDEGLISLVEQDGFLINGYVGSITMRGKLRGLRDLSKQPIFKSTYKEGVQGNTVYSLDGQVIDFPRNGSIIPSQSLLIGGDWIQLMYAIRKDIQWTILTEAVIQDPVTKEIIFNLAQQDMVALRATMRLGWQVPNPINRLQPDEDERYPFGVLIKQGS